MTLSRRSACITILLVLGLCAECTPEPTVTEEGDGPRFTQIINGAPSGAFSATGFLDLGDGHSCSGTLVAPDKVLTAAHCLEFRDASKMQFVLGDDTQNSKIRAGVESGASNPMYLPVMQLTPEHDIAVLTLREPITEVEPVVLDLEERPDFWGKDEYFVGKKSLLVGYGADEVETKGGTRREVEVTWAATNEHLLRYDFQGTGSCFGDSGGPAFAEIDGEWRQIGITAREDKTILDVVTGQPRCHADGTYTRVSAAKNWLQQQGVTSGQRSRQCGKDGECDGMCYKDPDCASLYTDEARAFYPDSDRTNSSGPDDLPYVAPNSTGHCGDKSCRPEEKEDCTNCVADCGYCLACGDGSCNYYPEPGETLENCSNCPQDCGQCAVCGDGSCWENMGTDSETCASCPQDCCPSDSNGSKGSS